MPPTPVRRAFWLALASSVLLLCPGTVSAQEVESRSDPILEHAYRTARDDQSPGVRVGLLLRVADAATHLGDEALAERALEDAEAAAEQVEPADHLWAQIAEAYAAAGHAETARAVAGRISNDVRRTEAMLDAADGLRRAGDEAGARNLVEEAVQRARREENAVQRDRLLTTAARALGKLGRLEDARRALELIDAPPRRTRGLIELAAICPEGSKQAAELRGEATALVEGFSAQQLLAFLDDGALTYAEAVESDAALDFMRRAEAAARDLGSAGTRRAALLRIADLYGQLGQWQGAARVAGDLDQPYLLARYELERVLDLAERGETEPAARMLQSGETDFLQYAGRDDLVELARLYQELHPRANERQLSSVEPKRFREAVYGAFAQAAAAEGRYERARALAERVTYRPDRARAQQRMALAAIEASGAEPDAPGLRFALEAVRGELTEPDKLDVLYRIGRLQLEAGHAGGAEAVISHLRALVDQTEYGETRALGLSLLSALLDGLGRREEALETVTRAMTAAEKIGCASCRDETLETAFGHFHQSGSVALIRRAIEELDPPDNLLTHALEAARRLEGLGDDARRFYLGRALEASLSQRQPARRVVALVRVAEAYRDVRLNPGEVASRALSEPPEPYVRPTPLPAPTRSREANLVYYYRTGCKLCREAKQAIDSVLEAHPDVNLAERDLDANGGSVSNKAICMALGLPESDHLLAPSLFSAREALIGEEIGEEAVAELIERARGLPGPLALYAAREQGAEADLRDAYQSLGLLAVAAGGLVDGINPCAFTVIIFFLSYLAYIGRSRKQIAWAGGIFTAAVFLTYLGAGLGLARLVQMGERWSEVFERVLYGATAVLVFVAAVLSFRDGVRCLRGETGELTLSLPKALRTRIRLTISRRARLGLTIGATAFLGAVVALIELPCTGQIYLPVILFGLHHLSDHPLGPVGWLLLYNLCFILPLIVVFIAVLFGLSSEALASWFRRHIAATKFALGVVFSALFVLMLVSLL